ncbi:MAG TPA: hypothetical protein VGK68_09780 [Gaiellaceae bacterium]
MPPGVASVLLPANLNFYSLQPDGRNLLVLGDTVAGGRCVYVRVRQTPLRVTARGSISCLRTSVEPVYPVLRYDRKTFTVRVRIAHVDLRTHRVSEGPVVMTFQQYSDTHLQMAYGPGTLWLFDTETPKGAEVLQVSARSGRVENIVHVPRIFRPVLAADDDGLWLAIATNGGAGRGPAPIYHVPLGAGAPILVHRGGRAALWIVATGHTVIADVLSGETHGELWRFTGAAARARALASANELNDWATSFSTDGSSVWTVREIPVNGKYYNCNSLQVIRIDAATGKQLVAATVPTPGSQCYGAIYSTFGDNAFLFLYGRKLYRVAT